MQSDHAGARRRTARRWSLRASRANARRDERKAVGHVRRLVRPIGTVVTRKRVELVDSADAEDRVGRDGAVAMTRATTDSSEKPFSLTPDPKYLYRSQSHANAFDLLQYAIRRREGLRRRHRRHRHRQDDAVPGAARSRSIATTFTALVLNPFLSEEDLLKRILQDFGVISRDEMQGGTAARTVSKQELIDALYDFLLGLIPLKAQRRADHRRGAEPAAAGARADPDSARTSRPTRRSCCRSSWSASSNLQTLLRSPELRQLDQRVSIRYELKPLDREGVGAYVAHRLGGRGRRRRRCTLHDRRRSTACINCRAAFRG